MALILSPPLKGGLDLVICFECIEYGRGDGLRFPKFGHKKTGAHPGHPLREASWHVASCPMERAMWQGPEGASG